MDNLKGKTAVVIGGHGLLGRQFVKTLKQIGVFVHVWDIQIVNDYSTTGEMGDNVDITQEHQIITALQGILRVENTIDILINCASINPQIDKTINNNFETYPLEYWEKTLSVNLTGTFLCCREFGKIMAEQEQGGVIVNLASQLGLVAPQQDIYKNEYIKPADYGVCAAGVISLTRYLASYWKDKIRVNCLVASMVYNNQNEEFVKEVSKRIPFGRMAISDEFNKALLFLASSDSSYMTGQTLICDGGYTSI